LRRSFNVDHNAGLTAVEHDCNRGGASHLRGPAARHLLRVL
jgi:hypothetical protein